MKGSRYLEVDVLDAEGNVKEQKSFTLTPGNVHVSETELNTYLQYTQCGHK